MLESTVILYSRHEPEYLFYYELTNDPIYYVIQIHERRTVAQLIISSVVKFYCICFQMKREASH